MLTCACPPCERPRTETPSHRLNDEFDYDYDLRDLEDFVLLTTTSVIDIQESERAQAERAIAEFVLS